MIKPADGGKGQGYSKAHQAIDWGSNKYFDTPIIAPFSGTVTATGQMGSGTNDAGLAVDIVSSQFKVRLCHLNSISVKVGQNVSEGQEIGRMGYTGYTIPKGIGGTHCHIVLWVNNVRDNIEKYITKPYKVNGVNMDKITKEQENLLSFLATGDNPGKGYDYRFTGQPLYGSSLNQLLNFWREVQIEWEKNKPKGVTRQEVIDYVIKNLK